MFFLTKNIFIYCEELMFSYYTNCKNFYTL